MLGAFIIFKERNMAGIPEGFNTITPTLIVNGAAKAIDLYVKAFGATEDYRMMLPGSDKIVHACINVGNSKLFLCDVIPGMCPTPSVSNFYLYFADADAAFKKATQAGLTETVPMSDMFWGDRMGAVKDAFGVAWTIASHVRDVSPAEMEEGAKKMFGKAA